jgi:hypothetical protein
MWLLVRLFSAFGSWLPQAATERPFMVVQALTPRDAQGSFRPLTPSRIDNPAPVASRFFYRLTPISSTLLFSPELFVIAG